jgi:superfamily II DNA or RNA helicase
MANSYLTIHNKFPAAKRIGFSATPARLDGRGLKEIYQAIIQGPPTKWLIENNFLSPYKLYAPKNFLDLSKIKTVMGEYEKGKLEAEVMRPQVIGNVAHEYLKRAYGKRTIMFAASVKHSEALVTQLQLNNVRAIHLDADSEKPLRADSLDLLARGEVDVISNVGLFSEGLDIKAVECVIDAAPTQSLVNWLQRCGRALRTHPGKTHAIILDLASNCFRHGLPNEVREWTLEDLPRRPKKQKQNDEPVRICDKCYAASAQTATLCSECGHVFPIQSREITERQGELQEITEADRKALQLERKREQSGAATYEDLVALGIKRQYKNPHAWARFITEGRKGKSRYV